MGFYSNLTTAVVGLLAMVNAQVGETGVDNSTTPTTTQGEVTIHTVAVGKATNQFQPNSINANPGDIVTFQFYPKNHSVIRAEYGYPCVPYEDLHPGSLGFFSGFHPVAQVLDTPVSWNLTINDTDPVFFYCGAPGSCINQGMVGVINADSSTSIVTQIALAKGADYMLEPGEPFPDEAQTLMASMAASATATVTVTPSSTPTPTPTVTSSSDSSGNNDNDNDDSHHHKSSNALSPGAIAGIAIGAAAIALMAAALFFYFGRTKSLKEALESHQHVPQYAPEPMQASGGGFYQAASRDHSRHNSNLPPYAGFGSPKPEDKEPEPMEVGGIPVDRSIVRSPPTPYTAHQQQFGGVPSVSPQRASQDRHRLPSNFQLGTTGGPLRSQIHELYAPNGLSRQEAEDIERGTRHIS